MDAKETLFQLIFEIVGGISFLSDEQHEQYNFIMERLDDLEKAEQALLEIKCAIAKADGKI